MPKRAPTPAELVAAHDELMRRTWAVIDIVTAVARKTRPDHLPAGFQPLLQTRRRTIHPHGPKGHIQVRYDVGSNLEFPIELLAMSNRDVAVWARERIRACRHVTFSKVKRSLTDDVARAEQRVADATRALEQKRRELANLGSVPRYEKPARFPKNKKPRASA